MFDFTDIAVGEPNIVSSSARCAVNPTFFSASLCHYLFVYVTWFTPRQLYHFPNHTKPDFLGADQVADFLSPLTFTCFDCRFLLTFLPFFQTPSNDTTSKKPAWFILDQKYLYN